MRLSLLSWVVVLAVAGCMQQPEAAPARLRVVNAMPDTESIALELRGPEQRRLNLTFANSTRYLSLAPGLYEVSVNQGGRTLLRRSFGLSPGDRFTLVAQGYSKLSSEPNQLTSGARWHRVLAGAESTHANGLLPRFEMLRDDADSGEGEATLRLVNAVPGARPLSARLASGNEDLVGALKYPARSGHVALDPGNHGLEIGLASMPEELVKIPLRAEACRVYTMIVFGSVDGRALQALALDSPAAGCAEH